MLFADLDKQIALPAEIELSALEGGHVQELVAESLNQPPARVEGLARLITAKTGGNPFFVRQFLFALRRKGLIRHAAETGAWEWDLATIEAQNITDNVAELVIERIRELPAETRDLVQLAACIGADFDIEVLSLASSNAPDRTARLLAPAIAADVVLQVTEHERSDGLTQRHRFQHDRVQEAAHDMLADDRRSKLHARIGALLLAKSSAHAPCTRLT